MDNRSVNRGEVAEGAGASVEGAEQLSKRAIFSTPEMTGLSEQIRTTEVEETKMETKGVVRELARDEDEVENPEKYVGAETKLQVEERLREDAEDAQAEMGMGDPWTAKVTVKDQEELSRVVAGEVDKIISQKSFRPNELEKLRNEGARKAWSIFGRTLGGRN